ncbi:glycosyltransferase family 2 protein [Cryobacterium psychrophilum]|uniref:Glycosyltransferase family 2 protein n=1 Tax=Cryobacterium psychrophilum TaxID=41988 RepID=A0A4Y8KKL0_9MICO|nr:glycosyltransferase family 2 protein [Cryobacterium psychrophilum]TFD77101.1 glycosyltransferase family 2 protein [Cryobacterium psychrophilum]
MVTISLHETTPTRVAVVTVSYGSADVLGPFLATIPGASQGAVDIVVADNKPSTGVNDIAMMAAAAGACYLPLASNRGYGHAINAAVKGLRPDVEWVLISNPDVTLSAGTIDTLINAVDDDPTVGAIGPRILSSNGEVYPSARTIPSLRSGVGHALFANFWPRNPWTRTYRPDAGASLLRRDAGWLSGACLLVRRNVLLELHGFDESYFMYFEDVDLGYRIGKLGLRNVYEPAAVVVHTGAHSTQENAAEMIRAHHDSATKFLSKKYSGAHMWPVRVVLKIGLGLRARVEERRAH